MPGRPLSLLAPLAMAASPYRRRFFAMWDRFESTSAVRAQSTLRALDVANAPGLILTGSLALEHHIEHLGGPCVHRAIHDIDFVCESYEAIPTAFFRAMTVRHNHPGDPPGKTLFQGVYEASRMRVDVFRAYGDVARRAVSIGAVIRAVSHGDMLARLARLCLPITRGEPIERKFARDFIRLLDLSAGMPVDAIWQEHRKAPDPLRFVEVTTLLRSAIESQSGLLVERENGTDPNIYCRRCKETRVEQRDSGRRMLETLGYC